MNTAKQWSWLVVMVFALNGLVAAPPGIVKHVCSAVLAVALMVAAKRLWPSTRLVMEAGEEA